MAFLENNTVTLFERVFGGNDYNYERTVAAVDAAIAQIEAAEHEVTGMAMAPAFRSALANIKEGTSSNKPLFPELQWGANPNVLGGLSVDTNSTVSFTGTGTGNTNTDRAIVGNFRDFFKWGIAREIPIEIIEYGNPDNDATAGDLKGHNQIYIRGEVFVGWGILVPEAGTKGDAITADKCVVDIGATSAKEASRKVKIGDCFSLAHYAFYIT